MRPTKRWLNLIVAVVALSFCLATTTLAVRGTKWADLIVWRVGERFGCVKSVAGSLTLQWDYVPGEKIDEFRQPGVRYDNYMRVESREGWWRREWFTWYRGPWREVDVYPGAIKTVFILPHWLFILLSGAIGLWFARRAWRDRQRRKRATHGQCTECGYDLRASPTCCPECGHAAGSAA